MTGRGERQDLRKLTVPAALSWSREEDMIDGMWLWLCVVGEGNTIGVVVVSGRESGCYLERSGWAKVLGLLCMGLEGLKVAERWNPT
jgi:hypothetical protein